MTRNQIVRTLALATMLGLASGAFAQNGTFTTIDYPGSTFTIPWWINGRGDIVGTYSNASGTHGFLLNGTQYTTIDYPSASGTELYGINNLGDMQGVYTLDGVRHGFLLSGSKFTNIEYPGATSTEAGPMNERGELVGLYVAADKTTHGFLFRLFLPNASKR